MPPWNVAAASHQGVLVCVCGLCMLQWFHILYSLSLPSSLPPSLSLCLSPSLSNLIPPPPSPSPLTHSYTHNSPSPPLGRTHNVDHCGASLHTIYMSKPVIVQQKGVKRIEVKRTWNQADVSRCSRYLFVFMCSLLWHRLYACLSLPLYSGAIVFPRQ